MSRVTPSVFGFGGLVATLLLMSAVSADTAPPPDAASTQSTKAEGVIIEEERVMTMQNVEQKHKQLTRIKGAKQRIDIGEDISTIFNEDGSMVTLMHKQKICMKMSPGRQKLASEEASNATATQPAQSPAYVATGDRQNINGFEAERYTLEINTSGNTAKLTVWMAKDFPKAKEIRQCQDTFTKTNKSHDIIGKAAPNMVFTEMPEGVQVRMETDLPMGGKGVTNLLSAKLGPIDDAVFDIPKDYKVVAIPMGSRP